MIELIVEVASQQELDIFDYLSGELNSDGYNYTIESGVRNFPFLLVDKNLTNYSASNEIDILVGAGGYYIGIEYQGGQHFKPKAFERDLAKFQKCKENGLLLLYISPSVNPDWAREYHNQGMMLFNKRSRLKDYILKVFASPSEYGLKKISPEVRKQTDLEIMHNDSDARTKTKMQKMINASMNKKADAMNSEYWNDAEVEKPTYDDIDTDNIFLHRRDSLNREFFKGSTTGEHMKDAQSKAAWRERDDEIDKENDVKQKTYDRQLKTHEKNKAANDRSKAKKAPASMSSNYWNEKERSEEEKRKEDRKAFRQEINDIDIDNKFLHRKDSLNRAFLKGDTTGEQLKNAQIDAAWKERDGKKKRASQAEMDKNRQMNKMWDVDSIERNMQNPVSYTPKKGYRRMYYTPYTDSKGNLRARITDREKMPNVRTAKEHSTNTAWRAHKFNFPSEDERQVTKNLDSMPLGQAVKEDITVNDIKKMVKECIIRIINE